MPNFVVKIRNTSTRSWSSEVEISAASAQAAAEQVATGQRLRAGPGERADLRASVWRTPYGSSPAEHFYGAASSEPS